MARKRLLVVVPALTVIAWMAVQVFGLAIAGSVMHDASQAMDLWSGAKPPTPEALAKLRDDLQRVTYASDADVEELLGLAYLRARRAEYLDEARVHLLNALRLRPGSPYTWANIVTVDYRIGRTGKEFENALVRAQELGPYERDVQRAEAFFGLAVWGEIGPKAQAAVERSVAAGMRRNPLEMLQIAQRRGRLAVTCRHFAGTPRLSDPKWSRICQSTEVSS